LMTKFDHLRIQLLWLVERMHLYYHEPYLLGIE
jgi:hypothetical protein